MMTSFKFNTLNHRGFTLLELMVVIAIIGTLAAIAIPNYLGFREKANITRAISDLKGIEGAIQAFMYNNNRLPNTLLEAGLGNPVDPWGKAYVYYPVDSVPFAKLRKDKSLVPVNTDYDLYSMGADGNSMAPFTAKASHDDIVRANNGSFIGLAKNY
jgi:general secretion pathway protein G